MEGASLESFVLCGNSGKHLGRSDPKVHRAAEERMKLAKSTKIRLTEDQSNIIGHMGYAASKLWNVCNYERRNWQQLGYANMPSWYDQKKSLKSNMWYKSLPSQSAQEVCKDIGEAWTSYFAVVQGGKVPNARPPRYKQTSMPVTYMQNGLVHHTGDTRIRLSIPKKLKEHMQQAYGIHSNYLWIESDVFSSMNAIKQIVLYPPENGECTVFAVYEVPDVPRLADNGHYLSIDLGFHNQFTCYDSEGGCFIAGRMFQSIRSTYYRRISLVQSQWHAQQKTAGVQYPKSSDHIKGLYRKLRNRLKDYLHKVTRAIVTYCERNGISVVIIGDLKGIRKENSKGRIFNQKMHTFPFEQIYSMLHYKLAMSGITLVRQEESYTSQCSPLSPEVSRRYANPHNRVHRGLYKDGSMIWNADSVGAFNIMRKWLAAAHPDRKLDPAAIGTPIIMKVAV